MRLQYLVQSCLSQKMIPILGVTIIFFLSIGGCSKEKVKFYVSDFNLVQGYPDQVKKINDELSGETAFISVEVADETNSALAMENKERLEGFPDYRQLRLDTEVFYDDQDAKDDSEAKCEAEAKCRAEEGKWRFPNNRSFAKEWEWNKDMAPPQTCLALSGGGTRSAAFSMGVLQALNGLGYLDDKNIDIISAVSGGAYTLSWFYAQQFNSGKEKLKEVRDQMFNPQDKYQKYLEENASIFGESLIFSSFLFNIPTMPVNLVLNGLFGQHANLSLPQYWYQGRIKKTFQINKDESSDKSINLKDLGVFSQINKLPLFILNSTVLFDEGLTNHGKRWANTIFEFTPIQYGSDALGRYEYPGSAGEGKYKDLDPITLDLATAISGAAADTSMLVAHPSGKFFSSFFNIDWGYYLDNPALPPGALFWHRKLPFPFYLGSGYNRDLQGTRWYLTDGGYSDNLGVFPLARRLCQRIIIVDGEHDPYYNFEGYWRVKRRLQEELNVRLYVKEIEQGKKADMDLGYSETILEKPKLSPGDKTIRQSVRKRWRSFAKYPVMAGKICCLPYEGRDKNLEVIYIKLAYLPKPEQSDEKQCDWNRSGNGFWNGKWNGLSSDFPWGQECNLKNPSKFVEEYFCCVDEERQKKGDIFYLAGVSEQFPQQPTTNADFNHQQYKAYRTLGCQIVRDSRKKKNDEPERVDPFFPVITQGQNENSRPNCLGKKTNAPKIPE